ncbi:hypothetical protein Vafri_7708 [Volvox africanus]|uniref:RNA helicase n=1 Tax=Volvox africanus TaxID=51714 RepID=A0A8J4B106_9CHLO|nr:hypothetical protein Vafri_7708 [Volvox africanus]
MVVQNLAAGLRSWPGHRCHAAPAVRPAGQWPQPAPTSFRSALRTTHPGCRRVSSIPHTTGTTGGLPVSFHKHSRTAASATRDNSGDASSGTSNSSRGGSGEGDDAEGYPLGDGGDLYGYLYDPDSQPLGPGGRSASLSALAANLSAIDDTNALQTALAAAIQSEDFELAAAVRDQLRRVAGGGNAAGRIDWAATGMPSWLADRAQRLGYRFPTEIQRRSAPVLLAGSDAVVASETGSGKTLSFLLPLLARMSYPPDIFMDEMKGPQGLVVVPTMELGVQVALAAFRLLGGNVSAGRPGDQANMFTYFGPKAIKVRGILNKEEVVMAKSSLTYTAQVHLLVATPAALREAVGEPHPAGELLRHLKVLAVDEVDECFSAFPADMDELMRLAADPGGRGNSLGTKPQVIFVGATQRQDVLQTGVSRGWLREPVSIQVGREGTIPTALSHRWVDFHFFHSFSQRFRSSSGEGGRRPQSRSSPPRPVFEGSSFPPTSQLPTGYPTTQRPAARIAPRGQQHQGPGSHCQVAGDPPTDPTASHPSLSDVRHPPCDFRTSAMVLHRPIPSYARSPPAPYHSPPPSRYIVVPAARRLAALARSLRADLAAADQDAAPARVMLFTNSPAEAAAVAEPLRGSLWSDHRMAVLVPPGTILGQDAASEEPPDPTSSPSAAPTANRGANSGSGGARSGISSRVGPPSSVPDGSADAGAQSIDDMFAYNPIRALHSFRDNKSTLLLATGAAARGLDLPGVSHVYSLGSPPDATQYLHRAGRAGRIGSTSGGIVTTLVTPEELPLLLDIGRQLGIRLLAEEEASGEVVGMLPRLQSPPDEYDELQEGEKGEAGTQGPSDGVRLRREAAAGGAPGQGGKRGLGEGEAGAGLSGELGDVDKLRKGLEDLFNLM